MMQGEAKGTKLQMKRLLNQRDAMHLLLSPPSNVKPNIERRCGGILDGDVSRLSSYKLASLLSAMLEDLGIAGDMSDPPSLPGRKRTRCEMCNNNHAVLLFVERVMHQRFTPSEQKDDKYVDQELKAYFGFRDVLFRVEEEIMCLAFAVSWHSIQQCLGHTAGDQPFDLKNIPETISNAPVIRTALGVIDFLVESSKRERVGRISSSTLREVADSTSQIMSKRQRYQHLLRNEQTRRDEAALEYEALLSRTVSVIEENYPDHWAWLISFRQKYSEREAIRNGCKPKPASHIQPSTQPSLTKAEETTNPSEKSNDVALSSSVHVNENNEQVDENSQEAGGISIVACEKDTTGASQLIDSFPEAEAETSPDITPLEVLDKKAYELRVSLISMPPSDLSHAVGRITGSIVSLLKEYGDLDGASGIARCGDVIHGARVHSHVQSNSVPEAIHFHLSDDLVSSVTKDFLTDATGALRAKAFLRSFVLPLLLDMNPEIATEEGASLTGKPASRLLTSLLSSLARDRPMECVESVLIPILVSSSRQSLIEPNRFQCELIARVLRGKDALSIPAIALLIEKMLPSNKPPVSKGMAWTENSMPLISTSLNRQPPLSDTIVVHLADRVTHYLSPAAVGSNEKSMKFSTIFHVFVSKYGQQVKALDKVDSLTESAGLLKTFMSKTINIVLAKL
jgi:hypothetical protein